MAGVMWVPGEIERKPILPENGALTAVLAICALINWLWLAPINQLVPNHILLTDGFCNNNLLFFRFPMPIFPEVCRNCS
jgi:hypothetical protein